jgi:hypothetical protein
MSRKLAITFVAFALVASLVFAAGALAAPGEVSLPQAIAADTPCPVAGCAQPDGACHGAGAAPVIDGSFAMLCPKAKGCTDVQCHAYERLTTHYNRPSDFSMNLWIVTPVILVVALVFIVKRLK